MNLLLKKSDSKQNSLDLSVGDPYPLNLDLNLLMNPQNINKNKKTEISTKEKIPSKVNSAKCLVDLSFDTKVESKNSLSPVDTKLEMKNINHADKSATEIKLKDIHVELKDIRPSSVEPVTILEKNQVLVTLHHAKDRPKEYVKVFVMTTVNKNDQPLSNYLLQAVVPKVIYHNNHQYF